MDPCNASEIESNLWLGGKYAITSSKPFRDSFDVILTALTEAEVRENKIRDHVGNHEWYWFPLDDSADEDISQHFFKSHDVIETALKQGKRVYVHCAAGISRSSTLVLAHYMLQNGWTRRQAMEFVAKRRPCIQPNDEFMNDLKRLEWIIRTRGTRDQT
jgi:protein-tyrosine phosphatase